MGNNERTIYDDIEQGLLEAPVVGTAIDAGAMAMRLHYRIIQFRGVRMFKPRNLREHYIVMDRAAFERAVYPLIGGMSRNRLNDVFHYLYHTAEDLTANDHLIVFGAGTKHPVVWDMEMLEVRTDISPDDCVWNTPYSIEEYDEPIPTIMELANGSKSLYSDIIQSLAPVIMAKKPVGVVWWAGGDMDNKNALIRVLREVFPSQISNLSVQQLTGGRSNTPLLNGALGNISEDDGQVTDNELYKNLGSHQDFATHLYHSQRGIVIQGNVHHIFSVETAPKFSDRNLSTDLRTHILQFGERVDGEPLAAIDSSFYGQLIAEICKHAVRIKRRGYQYKWRAATRTASSL